MTTVRFIGAGHGHIPAAMVAALGFLIGAPVAFAQMPPGLPAPNVSGAAALGASGAAARSAETPNPGSGGNVAPIATVNSCAAFTAASAVTGAIAQNAPTASREIRAGVSEIAAQTATRTSANGAPTQVASSVGVHGFCFTPRGSVELSYTDNVLLTDTNRKADYITIPEAGFNLTGRTPHASVTIDGSIFYDFYGATTRFNGVGYTGLANVKADIIDRYLTLAARVATDQQNINPLGAAPALTRTFGQNQAQVLNYGATPDFRWRAGDFFIADTQYDISLVNYYRAASSTTAIPASDSVTQTASINLRSGPDFSRLTWTADGSITRQDRPGPNSASNHRVGEASLFFAAVPNFQVVATGGYDDIVEPTLNQKLGGAHVTGGFRWSLSPRTKISFDGGRRYQKPYYTGDLSYSASAALVLHASYTKSIETPQSLAGLNLNNIVSNPSGGLVNPITGLPANPNDNPFGLNNQAFRDNSLQVGVNGVLGRTSYSLSGTYDRRISDITTSTNLGGTATLKRQLSRSFSDSLSIQYSQLTGLPTVLGGPAIAGTKSDTVAVKDELDYILGSRTTLALSYIYQRKHAIPLLRTLENVGVLTLNRTF